MVTYNRLVIFPYLRVTTLKDRIMSSNYIKIFSGSAVEVRLITSRLHQVGIEAIIKDEAESARLAGFGTTIPTEQDILVHKDEEAKAKKVIAETMAS